MVTRPDAEQLERNQRGVASCRAVLAAASSRRIAEETEDRPMTRSDEIHAAALAQAAKVRRRRSA